MTEPIAIRLPIALWRIASPCTGRRGKTSNGEPVSSSKNSARQSAVPISGSSLRAIASRSRRPGSITSCESRETINSPLLAARQASRATPRSLFGRYRHCRRCPYEATASRVPSVDPSSTTSSSTGLYSCARSDAKARAITSARLCVGMMTRRRVLGHGWMRLDAQELL